MRSEGVPDEVLSQRKLQYSTFSHGSEGVYQKDNSDSKLQYSTFSHGSEGRNDTQSFLNIVAVQHVLEKRRALYDVGFPAYT